MLPYETLEEAAASLGRNLTSAETLWFKYSAQKSDFVLYCHTTLFLFIVDTIAALPFMVLELMRSKKIDKFKLQPNVKNSLPDMWDCYKNSTRGFFTTVAPVQFIYYPMLKMAGLRTGLPLPSGSGIFWQLLVYFVIEDYCNYWLHRMLHQKWGYEKIHRIHHEYSAPMVFSAPHAHWAEGIIVGSASFFGPLIVPGHMITFWLWFSLRQMETVENHSGYEFPWSPWKFIPFYGGSAFHDFHHFVGEKSQSNFASVFTYCDYVYGTNKGFSYMKEYRKTSEKLKEK